MAVSKRLPAACPLSLGNRTPASAASQHIQVPECNLLLSSSSNAVRTTMWWEDVWSSVTDPQQKWRTVARSPCCAPMMLSLHPASLKKTLPLAWRPPRGARRRPGGAGRRQAPRHPLPRPEAALDANPDVRPSNCCVGPLWVSPVSPVALVCVFALGANPLSWALKKKKRAPL